MIFEEVEQDVKPQWCLGGALLIFRRSPVDLGQTWGKSVSFSGRRNGSDRLMTHRFTSGPPTGHRLILKKLPAVKNRSRKVKGCRPILSSPPSDRLISQGRPGGDRSAAFFVAASILDLNCSTVNDPLWSSHTLPCRPTVHLPGY